MFRLPQLIVVIFLLESCFTAIIPLPIQQTNKPIQKLDTWYRLPSNTVPETYHITLTTNIHQGIKGFNGTVEIGLKTVQDTQNITIHKRHMDIIHVDLWQQNSTNPELIDNIIFDGVTEKLTILTENILPNNTQYLLKITYNGTLRTDQAGFYESYYFDERNKKR